MKRLVSILCVCAMFMGMLPMMSLPVSASLLSSGDFLYEVTDGQAEISYYTGSATTLSIPSTLGGYTVARIGEWAFAGSSFKSVTIPNSVTSIGAQAFRDCLSLQSVKIGSGVKTMGEGAFANCGNLENITIPDNVTSIGAQAFCDCPSLQSVKIGSGVKTIGDQAFSNCGNLENITIPDNVTSVGTNAFSDCTSLQSVTFGSGLKSIGDYAFVYCSSLTSITIPNSVTSIGACAFSACDSLQSVKIGNGVKTIDTQAFGYCDSLKSITIPHNVTSIGEYVFESCSSLQSITIGSGLKSIGRRAFRNCGLLKTITVNSKNTAYCSVNGILFTKDKKTLLLYPAQKTATSYTIPSSVKEIGEAAFLNCKSLKSITISNTLDYIGESAFSNCTSLKMTIINSKAIGRYAFSGCEALQRVVLPNDAENIGPEAFGYCSSLKSITIPKSVTNIGWDAFYECPVFYDVYYNGTRDQWNAINSGNYNEFIPDGVNVHYNCSFAKITAQSATAAYANHNANASVKVTAKGDGLSYTWYIKNPGQTTYSKSSTTAATYTARMTAENSGRLAYCLVKDEYGNEVRSKTFELRRKATITSESATVVYAKHNANASAKVAVQGDGLSYAWYVKKTGDTAYTKSNVTGATYTAKMTAGNSDSLVCCVVRDRYGNKVQSKTFVLRRKATVTSEPATAAYAKMGENVSVKIGAAGDGLTYTWYFKNASDTKYAKSSVKSATYSATMSDTVKNRRVYCVVKDKYGKTAQTKTFLLREAVSIVTQPKSTVVAKEATAKVTVKASGDGLSYAWYIKNAGQTKYTKSSVKSATYSATMNAVVKDRYVYCVVTDQYGNKVQSKTCVLRCKVAIISEPATAAYAKKGDKVSVKIGAMGDGLSYTWYFKNANGMTYSKSSVTTPTYSATMSDAVKDRRVYCVVKDKYGNSAQTKTFILRVPVSSELLYEVRDGGAIIYRYTGSAAKLTLPTTLGGYPVTGIQENTFEGNTSLKEVIVGNGVTSIGRDAFYQCTALQSITLPSSVTSIGERAFLETAYYENSKNWVNGVLYVGTCLVAANETLSGAYTVRNGTTAIGDYAFDDVGLTSLTLPNSLVRIGESAFSDCSALQSVKIPDSVLEIGDYAFSGCASFKSIMIPARVTRINDGVFSYCDSLRSIVIPNHVTHIGADAFGGCSSLKSISIPDSVISIGQRAFSETAYFSNSSNWTNGVLYIGKFLVEVKETLSGAYTVRGGTTVIVENAFSGCESLQSVTVPSSVKHIGSRAFNNIGFITVASDNTAYSSQNGVLFNKARTELIYYPSERQGAYTVPSTVTVIGDFAFHYGQLSAITFPAGLEKIGDFAFHCCGNLQSIILPSKVRSIGTWSFGLCQQLKKVVIPPSVKTIGNYAFCACTALEEVVISEGVTTLGCWAFCECSSLKTITLPSTLTNIKSLKSYVPSYMLEAPFLQCTSLTAIMVAKDNPVYSSVDGLLLNKAKTILYRVPNGWKGACAVPSGVQTLGTEALYGCENLTTLAIPQSVKTIERNALSYMGALTDVYYEGSQVQWNAIDWGDQEGLDDFAVHYNCSFAKITAQSATAVYANHNENASVKVTAKGDGLTYAWYIKNAGQTKYTKSSVTKATYSTTMNAASKDRLVYCVVTDKYGNEVRSKTVQLKMK